MHETEGPFMSSTNAQRMEYAGRLALLANADLSRLAADRSMPLYPLKPKHHAFDHMITRTLLTRLHPKFTWTFCDEDFNGRVV
eukprot:15345317-Alexandrium_andersonii.AAC.1